MHYAEPWSVRTRCAGGFRSDISFDRVLVETLLEAIGVSRELQGIFWARGKGSRVTELRGAVSADFVRLWFGASPISALPAESDPGGLEILQNVWNAF